ncbi:chaperone protein ClpC1, chloroplastic-like [Pistacia vera]|uniref:chaperone protein ClpC1, chloroplastic-like n=1 Tax=Pistacia vera TaxID=55513 RepID=UPI001263460F|nr:chaperone protein ClpC1, chloroplastic-like [Pistacia vera]
MEKISVAESQRLSGMEKALQRHIIGQPEAVEAVSRAVRRAKVGIRDPSRPLSGFLFAGSSGVGKTELAYALAVEYFGSKKSLIRIDMSEYMERYTVSKFIGSSPGYIGSADGGQLTDAVRRQPHSVVLFDEMEKAHPDVLNIMLQVLDDGRLTDNKGKTVNFKNTFIIMTSNVGSDIIAEESHLGYDEVKMKVTEELKKNFKPEFLNRFDELIVFRQLTYCELKAIVEIMLKELYQRVKAIKINLEVTEKFKEELVRQGNDPAYGARPLKRAIRRLVEDTLAEKILSGAVKEEDNVKMDFDSNGNIIVKQSFVLE